MQHFESNWKTKDGLFIYAQGWQPEHDPKAVICIVHGLGEHSGRYEQPAYHLTSAGYAVSAFDLRGHGKSQGPRGHAPDYNILMEDISLFLAKIAADFHDSVLLLYGHSMGGNLVINYILRRHPALKGVIATSPYLRLAFKPPGWKLVMRDVLNKILPAFSFSNGLNPNHLSHDTLVVQQYINDPLVHDRITPRLSMDVENSGLWALEHASEFPIPLLLMHGESDVITSPNASREFAKKIGDRCRLKVWKGLLHEIHNEPEKDDVLNYMDDWIKGILV